MASLSKKLIIISLTIGLSIAGCTSSNQSNLRESKELKPTERVEPSTNSESLWYLYQADNLSQFTENPQYDKAIDLYTEAIKADPNNACAYEGRASLYQNFEKYDLAIADLTQSIAIDPQNISAYPERASIYYVHLDENDKAIADVTKAIALTSKDKSRSLDRYPHLPSCGYPDSLSGLYTLRALIFLKLEQFDRAIEDADRVVALSQLAYDYHFRAFVYREAKQYENAIVDESIAIATHLSYAHAYRGRAESYGKLKQYDLAIADYTKAISLYAERSDFGSNNDDYASAYLGRADVYRELKQYDQAIADYDKSLAVYPRYAYAYKSRGELYKELGKIYQAKQDLSQAASLYKEKENIKEYQIVQQQLQQL